MVGHLGAFHVTNLWQNTSTETLEDVAPNVLQKQIEDELDISEDEYIPAFQKCTQHVKTYII